MRNCPVLLIAKRKTSKRESQNTYICVHRTRVKRNSTYIFRDIKVCFFPRTYPSITRVMQASKLMKKERISFLLKIMRGCMFKYPVFFCLIFLTKRFLLPLPEFGCTQAHYAYRIYTHDIEKEKI